MTHENVGGGAHGLGLGGAQDALQGPADDANHPLHDAHMVQDCDERRKEDNDGKHLEREREPDAVAHEFSKQKGNPLVGVVQQAVHTLSQAGQQALSPRYAQHKGPKAKLQGKRPRDSAPRNGASVLRKGIRQAQQDRHAKNTHQHARKLVLNPPGSTQI